MAGAIHNRHKTGTCLDCPKPIYTLGNKKRCDDCQHAVERARKNAKERARSARRWAEAKIAREQPENPNA